MKENIDACKVWSEEDIRFLMDIRDAITLDYELEESYKEKLYDWLKSLEKRIIPQPNQ